VREIKKRANMMPFAIALNSNLNLAGVNPDASFSCQRGKYLKNKRDHQ
jgi:hypothetical protein